MPVTARRHAAGVTFGSVPVAKAAQLDPIDALRCE
jgi:hypothetical protein